MVGVLVLRCEAGRGGGGVKEVYINKPYQDAVNVLKC